MPGTGGPRVIQGVGFWAQQQYYNIFSVDSGPFIFRPPIKGLPEQPYPPNAFQSWTYSYNLNLIGQDRFPTGEQFWERPQLPIPPLAPTWIQTQFPVLFMQPPGQPLVGAMWFDLPPVYFTDYQRSQDLRTWLQGTTALTLPPPVFVPRP